LLKSAALKARYKDDVRQSRMLQWPVLWFRYFLGYSELFGRSPVHLFVLVVVIICCRRPSFCCVCVWC